MQVPSKFIIITKFTPFAQKPIMLWQQHITHPLKYLQSRFYSMKAPQQYLLPALLFLLFASAICMETLQSQTQVQDANCTSPLIYEYIENFTLPLNDIPRLISTNLSQVQIDDFKGGDKVNVTNVKFESRLLSDKQSIQMQTPLSATVINDQVQFIFHYKMSYTANLFKHTFNVTTAVDGMKFSFKKEFKQGNSNFQNVQVTFTPDMMKNTFQPKPNSSQLNKLLPAIQGNSTTSLFKQFELFIAPNKVKQYLESNARGEHLSKVYQSNPYNYTFYDFSVNVDVSTLSSSTQTNPDTNTTNVLNGISGKLPKNALCSNFTPDFNNTGSNMFFTYEFIQNFIELSIQQLPSWKSVQIDRTWMRSDVLQFTVLDLEFIVAGLFNYELADFYNNDIVFRCSALKNVDSVLDSETQKLYQTFDWQCYTFVTDVNGTQVKIMDFQPRTKHTVNLRASNYFSVSVDKVQYVDCQYREVDGKYKVTDPQVARKYIESTFNDFRVYTIGGFFKVKQGSTKIQYAADNKGIWIM